MTRALVTGSTGFVGSNLVAALNARGIDVVALQRKTSPQDAIEGLEYTPVIGDLGDLEALRRAMAGVDWVFHLAAVADYWRTGPELIYKVNVDGGKNVMQAALDAGVKRVVLTSSSAALGIPDPPDKPMDEHSQFNLTPEEFPYGHSKHLVEEAMKDFVGQGLDVVSVLPTAVLGPRDLKFNGGELIVQALKPTLPILPVPRGGVNWIDVRDLTEGMIGAAEKGRTGERYVLGGHNLNHVEVVKTTNEVLDTSLSTMIIPRWILPAMGVLVAFVKKLGVTLPIDKGRVMLSGKYMYYDNSKAVEELGLTIRPFAESVRDSYEWYLENDYLAKNDLPLAPVTKAASGS